MFKEKVTESLDSAETLTDHRNIIQSKPLLKKIYNIFYHYLLDGLNELNGNYIEIGSGGYNAKDHSDKIKSSEIIKNPYSDLVIDAMNMNLANSSVDAYVMLNTLHHIREPQVFFSEVVRTLKPNGEIRLIEPYCSFWSRIIYTYFHHEPFYESTSWSLPATGGRMTTANQMIPSMIFIRDLELFKKQNPSFEILEIKYLNIFSYILSGGLSFKSPIPNLLINPLLKIESWFAPLNKYLGLFMFVKIRKKPS